MLSGRLIRLIEDHQEQIATNVIREIRRRPDLAAMRRLADAELRERSQEILENLGHWLSIGQEEEIAQVYQRVGKSRFEQGIP
ncbi:MAG TPA: RsbRD N-terminal domain-containing protein, partial [Bryobacteraceae bacterium]|nr:RsbRD N-terminal domain-containing protein [Bryobacteraceae bacterium]